MKKYSIEIYGQNDLVVHQKYVTVDDEEQLISLCKKILQTGYVEETETTNDIMLYKEL